MIIYGFALILVLCFRDFGAECFAELNKHGNEVIENKVDHLIYLRFVIVMVRNIPF